MRTIKITESTLGRIPLGWTGEYEATEVIFDLSNLIQTYGDGVAEVLYQRTETEAPYVVPVTRQDQTAVWVPQAVDLAVAGNGLLQMHWYVGENTLAKTKQWRTFLWESLPVGGNPPTPEEQTWLEQVLAVAAAAEAARDDAAKSAASVASTLQSVSDQIALAEEHGTLPFYLTGTAVTTETGARISITDHNGTTHADLSNGADGANGKSAYAYAAESGYTGTEAEFSERLTHSLIGISVNGIQQSVENGIAVVPTVTPEGSYGVVRMEENSGIQSTAQGALQVQAATKAQITNRAQSPLPLVPSTLDHAVKAAFCDGVGADWSETEQQAGRARLGLPKSYELIETITITESMQSFERTAEPDGAPYSFRSLLLIFYSPGSNGSHGSKLHFYSTDDGSDTDRYTLSLSFTTNTMNRTVGIGEVLQPGLQMPFLTSSTSLNTSAGTLSMGNNAMPTRPITKFELIDPTVPSIGVLTTGDTITVYGIRW